MCLALMTRPRNGKNKGQPDGCVVFCSGCAIVETLMRSLCAVERHNHLPKNQA